MSVVSIANSAEIESASWSSIVSNQTTLNAISASFNIVPELPPAADDAVVAKPAPSTAAGWIKPKAGGVPR